ncbi:hypothetical protein XHV734_0114 [Xanthomonas hortorum pv. vitians]|nr:hypothetical protein XHV734_0114 [Xanthomonas hortorum pv. vitians]
MGGQGPCNQAADQPLCNRRIHTVRFTSQGDRELELQRRLDVSKPRWSALVEGAMRSPLAGHAASTSM